jgi:hypothetical protein
MWAENVLNCGGNKCAAVCVYPGDNFVHTNKYSFHETNVNAFGTKRGKQLRTVRS